MTTTKATHTPGPVHWECSKCGWSGMVNGRPRCLECYRVRIREWRKNNPEKNLELKRRMDAKARAERPEQYNEKRRKYRKAETNSDMYKRRRDWLAAGDVTADELRAIYSRDGGKCVYCHASVKARMRPSDPRGFDHVVPRASGGRHTGSNLVVACKRCNCAKSST